jgi:hypothetical protein
VPTRLTSCDGGCSATAGVFAGLSDRIDALCMVSTASMRRLAHAGHTCAAPRMRQVTSSTWRWWSLGSSAPREPQLVKVAHDEHG